MSLQATMPATSAAATADAMDAAWLAAQQRLRWRRRIMPLFGGAALLFVWWALVAVFQVRPFIAPSPEVVAITFYQKFGMLMQNLWPTAIEAVCGFLLGNFAAITLATVFVHRKAVDEAFFPIAVLINSIPVVAKAPILVLLMGNGLSPKIAIAGIIVFFPTLVNMVRGLEAVNPQAMELMHVLSATKWEVFMKLRLQTSLPFLFSALKIAASTAVVGAIVGEWIGSQEGIGALIIQATYNFDSALLYATVLCGSFFSILFFLTIRLIERFVVRWQPEGAP
ncbi:ABC transporter permease [Limobrevibacterium gyesilva]|uniref:ABC transporter permease n=1 Tax=Limobrevibacterium gyesilva TaxID=2991712 RepID=A0AA41YVD1_9PROT|nr:ABC transporter permease [Limobrevibacterium gyesilva]MCW3476082.1 ABC transporter permease [Limobrevibacterium gyesilva]